MGSQQACSHAVLWPTVQPSAIATSFGYKPFSPQQRFTAATGSRQKISLEHEEHRDPFPLPLVLPGDELAHDPKYPPQSFNSWLNENARNELTAKRKTVYIANYPSIGSDAPKDHHRRRTPLDWTVPKKSVCTKPSLHERPDLQDVLAYLQAFFHDLPVTRFPGELEIGSWLPRNHVCEPPRKRCSQGCRCELPEYVELRSGRQNVSTRIRVRHLHEDDQCSAYQTQLNLNDILDHAIAILPEDAYCLLLLVDHDLYEDDQDDFCCGRAYGGSRIAVVSSAQYQPALDKWHGVDLAEGHNWPGSHCFKFVEHASANDNEHQAASGRMTDRTEAISRKKRLQSIGTSVVDAIMIDDTDTAVNDEAHNLETPLEAAVAAHTRLRPSSKSCADAYPSSYLRRVCLTASHELLHCFGLDHCVYYACAMQGTSSVIEDSRQPPYLCPVCENKLAKAVSKVSSRKVHAATVPSRDWWLSDEVIDWKHSRLEAMLQFCKSRGDEDLAFAPFAAWLKVQIKID